MTRHHDVSPRFAAAVLAAMLLAPSAGAGDLEPREQLSEAIFRAGGAPRAYTRLSASDRASYSFCGQGRLQVLSRAMMPGRTTAARYTLDLQIDGAAPGRELAYRVTAAAGAEFNQRTRAGMLRRTAIDLVRGCHTDELSLARSTVEAVAVRLAWDPRPATRRRWSDGEVAGGERTLVEVGDRRAPYLLLAPGEVLELAVDGPAWVRVLTRSVGHGNDSYALTVERKGKSSPGGAPGKPYRDYRLETSPSKRARLLAAPGTRIGKARVLAAPGNRIGKARDVVFAVGRGTRRLELRGPAGHSLLLRPEIAERSEDRLPGTPEPGWTARARLASYYDDNILRYSEKFIERFENGQDPDRFRVESLDDTVQRADVYLRRGFTGLASQPAELGFDLEHRDYLRNDVKDWSRFSASWHQELRRGRRLAASISWAPNFYVRHLRDSDLTGGGQDADPFQAFEFERAEARLRFGQELGASIDARSHLGVARFRHSPAFREFDSTNLFGGLRLDHELSRRLRLSYAFELTDSDARGWDQAGETRATSDDTDPSYLQLDLMLAARIRLPSRRRQILFLQAEGGRRDYTTTKSEDDAPLHAGREDDLLRLYASWQLDLARRYRLTVFAQSRERSSTAPIDLDIGVEKDYEQWEAGVRLSARFGD